jgi:hypothetical protein
MATMMTNKPVVENVSDTEKLELYRLIGEGYKAMKDGKVSTIEDVKKQIGKTYYNHKNVF